MNDVDRVLIAAYFSAIIVFLLRICVRLDTMIDILGRIQ